MNEPNDRHTQASMSRLTVRQCFPAVAGLVFLTGCQTATLESEPGFNEHASYARFPIEASPGEVRALTPAECKAVLVARAALEESRGEEIHARFQVSMDGENWSVTAFFNPPRGMVSPIGYFATVRIDNSWNVKEIVGGS